MLAKNSLTFIVAMNAAIHPAHPLKICAIPATIIPAPRAFIPAISILTKKVKIKANSTKKMKKNVTANMAIIKAVILFSFRLSDDCFFYLIVPQLYTYIGGLSSIKSDHFLTISDILSGSS